MRKFSEKINENESLKNYNYKMFVDLEGNITAHSEGDAGEIVDKLVDLIGATSPSIVVTNYQIEEINELGPRELDSDLGESYYIPKVNEDVDNSTGSMKKYVVVIVMRDEWDEPKIEIIDAVDEENALIKAAINIGFEAEEFDGVDDVGLYLIEEYQDAKFIVKEIV